MKNWFQIKNKASGVLDISIHEEIGSFGISAREFMAELKKHSDVAVINLSIHSPGGSVLDSLAIYNSLRNHGAKIHGRVEGVAASAASFILMASDTITMPEDSFIMIHSAWGGAMGEADELRDMADTIDKLNNSIVNIYERRTGLDRETIIDMMKAESWISAEQALELGFADTISDKIGIAAKLHGMERHFKELPIAAEADILRINDINDITEFGKFLRDAGGFSRKATDALVARGKKVLTGNPDQNPDLTETGKLIAEALNKAEKLSALIDA